MNSLDKFAAGLAIVQRVAYLPGTTGLPDGALALLTTSSPQRLYQIAGGAWALVTASTAITGQLQSTDIANIQASQINGMILAAQISQINAAQINGSLYASSISSVTASVISGALYASSISSVAASVINGQLYASSIASVYGYTISGAIYASVIGSISASQINGTIQASQIGTVNSSSITVFGNVGVGSIGYTAGFGVKHIASAAVSYVSPGQFSAWDSTGKMIFNVDAGYPQVGLQAAGSGFGHMGQILLDCGTGAGTIQLWDENGNRNVVLDGSSGGVITLSSSGVINYLASYTTAGAPAGFLACKVAGNLKKIPYYAWS